jgi:hypothetical protein
VAQAVDAAGAAVVAAADDDGDRAYDEVQGGTLLAGMVGRLGQGAD